MPDTEPKSSGRARTWMHRSILGLKLVGTGCYAAWHALRVWRTW